MYCSKCGKLIDDDSTFCVYCGNEIRVNNSPKVNFEVNDESNTGLNIISFFLPIVGLILYILYHEKEPIKAKALGKWALIGIAIGIVIWTFYSAMIASTFSYY